MKTSSLVGFLAAVLLGIAAPVAEAQRGAGDPIGVARRPVKPEVVTRTGKLVAIRTAPCEATTGRSPIGTHIVLETTGGEALNVHLGPAAAVADAVAELPVGDDLTVEAFRTAELKAGHYIARALTFGATRVELRDEQLRPVWASGGVRFAGSATSRPGPWGRCGPGSGPGGGRGGCCGRWGAGVAVTPSVESAPGPMGMSAEEHGNIFDLLSGHAAITRTVRAVPGGVKTTTTTSDPALVATLRAHARQMARHVEQGRPVRIWDPVFRDVFAHSDAITLVARDVEGGIEVTETSADPEAVAAIRAHAREVSAFVAGGHRAARPPWAGGGGRGRMMRDR